MATPAGGKVRSKRSHNARKPYERPKAKSLLSRVSDTVKDFITPSWLNTLWTNPNDDDGEGSSRSSTPELPQSTHMAVGTPNFMPAAVATSTPDVDYPRGKEGLSIPRPAHAIATTPIVHSEDNRLDDSGKMEEDDDVVIIDEDQPSTSTGIKRTPLPFRNYADPIGTSTPNEDMQLLGGRKPLIDKDDASDTSVSTSGCSSLLPHIDKVDHREKLSKKNLDRLSEMGHSNSLAKSSLWTDSSLVGPSASGLSASRPQQPVTVAKRPSFNSSYFGSPKLLSETRPKNASPFYPGRTQFGGLSSQRTGLKRPRNSPYEVHLPVKRNIRPKPAPISQDSTLGATSSTAKKILDTLERMSTPLLDAKKIPPSPAASPYSFRPSSRLANLRGSSKPTNQPPVSGLRVPHQVSIAPSRQPPVTAVIDLDEQPEKRTRHEAIPTSTAAPTISTAPSFRFGAPASTSTPAPMLSSQLPQEKAGGKMKSKSRNTLHYSAQHADDEDVVEVLKLPEIALPLSKGMPKFSFTSLAESSTSKPSQPSLLSTAPPPAKPSSPSVSTSQNPTFQSMQFSAPISKVPSATSEASSDKPQFKFASPIIKQSSSGAASSSTSSSSSTFKFSVPRQTPYTTSRPSSSLPAGGKKPSFETPERTRRKEDEAEDDDGGYGGIKVAKELKTGSCLEAFGILPAKNGPIPSSSTMVQAHAAKVSNSLDNGPLSSSASQKTGESILHKAASKPSNSLLDKFKPAANSWECDMCMLQNKGESEKCLACETPKPGPVKAKQPAKDKPSALSQNAFPSDSKTTSTFNSLSNKFSQKADEWECDTCMIRNKDSAEKCVACSTARPGQSKSNAAPVKPQPALPINNVIADKFKAGAGEWECDTCMIRNKASILKCVACDTPKPGSSQTLSAPPASSFKFGSGSMSNGDATGALKFGSSTSSSTLNSNLNHSASKDTTSSIGGPFKLPAGVSIGQGFKPSSTDSSASSTPLGGGFKVPSNFSLAKAGSGSDKTTEKSSEPSFLSQLKSDEKSDSKLEVKVPGPVKFGASGSSGGSSSTTGGIQFGQASASKSDNSSSGQLPSGGFKFGQTLLDKEGPPPNVNLFESKVTEEEDGPASKKKLTFGSTSGASQEKKTESVPTGFKFGAAASTAKESTAKPSAASFQFGAGAATAAFGATKADAPKNNPTETKPSFSFGSTTSSASSLTPSTENKSQFSFGGAASSASVSTTASAASTPSFSFGGNKPADTTTTDAKTTFNVTFGAPSADKPPAYPQGSAAGMTFGAASKKESTAATTPAASFNFGQTPAAAASAPPSASAAPSFTFGNAAPASSKTEEASKSFTFGSQNQNNNQGTSSGFSFGATAASSNPPASTAPSFNFGAAAAKPAATTASSGFKFGSTPSSTPGFSGQFGASNTTPAPAFGASPATTQASTPFAFGATPTTTASNPFGGGSVTPNANPFGGGQTTSQSSSVFGSANSAPAFGASSGAAIGQTPAFGSGAGATTNSAPAFGSGAGGMTNSAPAFGASNSPSPAFGSSNNAFGSGAANPAPGGGFQFGKSQSGPAFNFGAANNAPSNASSGGAFQFSGGQQNQAPPAVAPQPAGGFSFSAAQPNSFNFAANAPQPGATAAFQFQGTAVTNDGNPFSASGTPAQPGRKIKRAVRRAVKR